MTTAGAGAPSEDAVALGLRQWKLCPAYTRYALAIRDEEIIPDDTAEEVTGTDPVAVAVGPGD
jgi:hypothetical protein